MTVLNDGIQSREKTLEFVFLVFMRSCSVLASLRPNIETRFAKRLSQSLPEVTLVLQSPQDERFSEY